MKKLINISIVFMIVSFVSLSGCSNDDDVFVEYVNPINNNPVNSVEWLIKEKTKVRTQMDSEEDVYRCQSDVLSYPITGYIELYNLEEEDYYLVYCPYISLIGLTTTSAYNASGELYFAVGGCFDYPEHRRLSNNFFNNAISKGRLWEYKFVK